MIEHVGKLFIIIGQDTKPLGGRQKDIDLVGHDHTANIGNFIPLKLFFTQELLYLHAVFPYRNLSGKNLKKKIQSEKTNCTQHNRLPRQKFKQGGKKKQEKKQENGNARRNDYRPSDFVYLL